MSRTTRRIALALLLAVAATYGLQQRTTATTTPTAGEHPAVQLASGFTLVEGWCSEICDDQCPSGCAQARTVGCTCYWVCENQEEGSQVCTGAVGVRICAS